MATLALVIFVLTYCVVSARRLRWIPLDRPSGTLVGAVLMVLCGVLTLDEAYAAVDMDTLTLLLGMMIVVAYLDIAGLFPVLARAMLDRARTATGLLALVVCASGVLSALFVNDTVCIVLTPVVLAVCREAEVPAIPYLLALATASNFGSAATLTGNPQNMLIGLSGDWTWGGFFLAAGPLAAFGMLVSFAVVRWVFRGELAGRALPRRAGPASPADPRLVWPGAVVSAGMVAAFLAGAPMPLVAITGAAALILAAGVMARTQPSDALRRVDWSLLVLFAGLFVVIGGLSKVGLVARAHEAAAPYLGATAQGQVVRFGAFSLVASNLLSNVPFVVAARSWVPAMADPHGAWLVLAIASTFAGNLTLLGSVANILVAEGARREAPFGFWDYLKVGLPATAIATVVAIAYLAIIV